ncbi:MAG: UDP-N-acetylmuramate dehydrogenase [Bacteroidia bacterium]|nr:UDP-N-acetylmuramate dehydrogenase [Bacteroidia bacterium]NND26089.1 UDP-N-acetylmuramate dehydrogenase [Flavobacteriaceae bacterium]NNL32936.1 UDP-N-acetylmuramate dehydrogenase [Flavobacteriaceae bacterium]
MQIQNNSSLKPFNTFGIDVNAKHFVSVQDIDELIKTLQLKEFQDKFILGGGSNMLLTKDIEALVVHLNLKGIEIVSEDESTVLVKAMAGENWHDFVLWCLDQNYGGIENLSLIPGNVGAAPIQNIGAYGVELKDVFYACEALDKTSFEPKQFAKEDCNFDYRNSVFKQDYKGKFIITSVTLKLSKSNHKIKTSYGSIQEELQKMGVVDPSIQDVSKAVIAIRSSKLPDPKDIGNSGSFFKNPIVSKSNYKALIDQFPDMPSYKVSEDDIKIPAGWLIEKVGFKGKRFGEYGVHTKQALVLVNYGNASGSDIFELSKLIQSTIKRIFNINLEAEVNII